MVLLALKNKDFTKILLDLLLKTGGFWRDRIISSSYIFGSAALVGKSTALAELVTKNSRKYLLYIFGIVLIVEALSDLLFAQRLPQLIITQQIL